MTTGRRRIAFFSGWLILGLLSASSVWGGTVYNFESCPNTNSQGDPGYSFTVWPLHDCDGWYTPTDGGTRAAKVVSYTAMGPYGLASDPNGGNNFLGLVLTPSGATRAQHDFNFSASQQWSISYDFDVVNMTQTGAPTTYGSYYIGGFSIFTIHAGTASFIADEAWDSSATDSTYSVLYFVYDASGHALNSGHGTRAQSGLLQNNWYTQSTLFDTKTNQILLVSLTDVTNGGTSSFSPSGWYLLGGLDRQFLPQGIPNVDPNALRFSGMGPTNAFLVDNVDLTAVPEPATLLLTGLGLIGLIVFRRR